MLAEDVTFIRYELTTVGLQFQYLQLNVFTKPSLKDYISLCLLVLFLFLRCSCYMKIQNKE